MVLWLPPFADRRISPACHAGPEPASCHRESNGVVSAGMGYDTSGAGVADILFSNGALLQFDSAGVHFLGAIS